MGAEFGHERGQFRLGGVPRPDAHGAHEHAGRVAVRHPQTVPQRRVRCEHRNVPGVRAQEAEYEFVDERALPRPAASADAPHAGAPLAQRGRRLAAALDRAETFGHGPEHRRRAVPGGGAGAAGAVGQGHHVAHRLRQVEGRTVDLGDAEPPQRLDLAFEDGAASTGEQRSVGDAVLRLLPEHLGEERHVPAVVGAHGDGVRVLLAGGLGYLVGGLVEADVDGLRALAAKDARDRRRSHVVAVADGSGYDESRRTLHEGRV